MKIIDVNNWNDVLDGMIVIGGSARSGTTIMGKLINSLENVEYYFEPPMLVPLLLKSDEIRDESLKELLQFYFVDNFLLDSLAGRNINLNENDDSCILHVKSKENIQNRYQRSFRRNELEKLIKKTIFSFKSPEVVFFTEKISTLFANNKKLFMHRNANDVINSLLKKGWFSNESLNANNPTQLYAMEIINDIKIPYWVRDRDKKLWVNMDEINRCGYYYMRISESILRYSNDSIVVDYDKFIQTPKSILNKILKQYNLKSTNKTDDILESIHFQAKDRKNCLAGLNQEVREKIEFLEKKLRSISNDN